MMKQYECPLIEVVTFEEEEIMVVTSTAGNDGGIFDGGDF